MDWTGLRPLIIFGTKICLSTIYRILKYNESLPNIERALGLCPVYKPWRRTNTYISVRSQRLKNHVYRSDISQEYLLCWTDHTYKRIISGSEYST